MDPYRHRTPNPYRRRHDLGLLSIFFLTIVLFFGVIAVLTVGSAWTVPTTLPQIVNVETRSSGLFGASAASAAGSILPNAPTPTPSNVNLGTVVQPTPVPPATPYPTPTGQASATTQASPTAQTTPTANPSPSATGTPGASPSPTPGQSNNYVIGNTDGVGAWLRRTPHMNDYLIAWVDGTRVTVIGPDVQSDGLTWKYVQDPQGNKGYIPADWVVPAP